MTSAEKRKEATIKLDFRPWLVLGGLLALAVLVTTIVLQTQNPYIHRRDKEAVVRDEDTEAQAAPVCRVHFASRKDTEVLVFHGVVEHKHTTPASSAFAVPVAGLLPVGTVVVASTQMDLRDLIAHVHESLCSSETSGTTCYTEYMHSSRSRLRPLSTSFLQSPGVSVLTYGTSTAFSVVVLTQISMALAKPFIMYSALAMFTFMVAVLGFSEFYEPTTHRVLLFMFAGTGLATHAAVAVNIWPWSFLRYYYMLTLVTATACWVITAVFMLSEEDLAFVILEHVSIFLTLVLMCFALAVLYELNTHVALQVKLPESAFPQTAEEADAEAEKKKKDKAEADVVWHVVPKEEPPPPPPPVATAYAPRPAWQQPAWQQPATRWASPAPVPSYQPYY